MVTKTAGCACGRCRLLLTVGGESLNFITRPQPCGPPQVLMAPEQGHLVALSGKPATYTDEAGESMAFCRDCGVPMFRAPAQLYAAVLDEVPGFSGETLPSVLFDDQKRKAPIIAPDAAPPLPLCTGGCSCGRLRFAASQIPVYAGYCHCRYCRMRAGSVAAGYVCFDESAFTFTNGRCRTHRLEAGEVGTHNCLDVGFCSVCGTCVTQPPSQAIAFRRIAAACLDDVRNFHPH